MKLLLLLQFKAHERTLELARRKKQGHEKRLDLDWMDGYRSAGGELRLVEKLYLIGKRLTLSTRRQNMAQMFYERIRSRASSYRIPRFLTFLKKGRDGCKITARK